MRYVCGVPPRMPEPVPSDVGAGGMVLGVLGFGWTSFPVGDPPIRYHCMALSTHLPDGHLPVVCWACADLAGLCSACMRW